MQTYYKTIAEKVAKHAIKNYNKGWGWIVECMSIDDIISDIVEFELSTYTEAIKHFAEITNYRNDERENTKIEQSAGNPEASFEPSEADGENPYGSYEEQCYLHYIGAIDMDRDI